MIIIFEGLDGAGKTTIINKLAQKFDNVIILTFPDRNSESGKEISNILQSQNTQTQVQLLSKLCANQIHDSVEYILEASNSNKIVLIDRFILSNYVYQQNPNLDMTSVKDLYRKLGNLTKVITIFLDIDAQTSILRTSKKQPEIFDKLEIQQKIYKLYKNILTQIPSTIKYSGYDTPEIITEKIYNSINTMYIL